MTEHQARIEAQKVLAQYGHSLTLEEVKRLLALIHDPRINGYNTQFLGAQPAKLGEDY